MLCLFFQLSNEMQLSIMNKVKSGELSIDDALFLARTDQSLNEQVLTPGHRFTGGFHPEELFILCFKLCFYDSIYF